MSRTFPFLFLKVLLIASTLAIAQDPDPGSGSGSGSGSELEQLAAKADEHFQRSEWKEAAELYSVLSGRESTNFRYWLRLGVARQNLEEFMPAIEAFQRVVDSQAPAAFRALARFQGAESLAGAGDSSKSLDWLAESVGLGFGQVQRLENSTLLARVKGERFEEILEKARRNQSPCLYGEKYGQFDFWVGEWDVFTPAGQKAGTNSVQRIVNGCVVFENWTSAGGGTGKSFNFYDQSTESWHQLWVDGQGNVLRLSGKYADTVLHYEGETVGTDGQTILERLRFFDLGPDRVRQLWEQSRDGGETWTVAFEGEYRRKPQ
jgi:tetratricopeptide (TPR) repeat protein